MLTIHDEELAARLQQIAELEHRPVEEVLKAMVAQYPTNVATTRRAAKRCILG